MEVEPVRKIEDRKKMYNWLKENYTPSEAECWLIGCNIALRASDLLSLRFDQFKHGQKTIILHEKKTGKRKEIPITPTVQKGVKRLRIYYASKEFYKSKKFEPVYLFQSTSRRAYHLCQPICIQYLSLAYKDASRSLGFDYNVNTHSMRKTFGYNAYESGADIHHLQGLFNHATSHVTLRYIGVTKSTIRQMYFDNSMEIEPNEHTQRTFRIQDHRIYKAARELLAIRIPRPSNLRISRALHIHKPGKHLVDILHRNHVPTLPFRKVIERAKQKHNHVRNKRTGN